MRVGSEGGSAGSSAYTNFADGSMEPLMLGSVQVFLGSITTMQLPLPADAKDEVILAILPQTLVCGPFFGTAGLLVDDLRLE